jgi:hypothetical protein
MGDGWTRTLAQLLLAGFAVSVLVVTFIVAARLTRCAFRALRVARYRLVVFSILLIVAVAGVFALVAAVWFGYGLAHSEKTMSTDLTVVLLTGAPFFALCYGVWRLSAYFESNLLSNRRG